MLLHQNLIKVQVSPEFDPTIDWSKGTFRLKILNKPYINKAPQNIMTTNTVMDIVANINFF